MLCGCPYQKSCRKYFVLSQGPPGEVDFNIVFGGEGGRSKKIQIQYTNRDEDFVATFCPSTVPWKL